MKEVLIVSGPHAGEVHQVEGSMLSLMLRREDEIAPYTAHEPEEVHYVVRELRHTAAGEVTKWWVAMKEGDTRDPAHVTFSFTMKVALFIGRRR